MKQIIFLWMLSMPIIVMAQDKPMSARQQKKADNKAKIERLIQQEEEGAIIFQKQRAFGIKLNTDGYGILFEKVKVSSAYFTSLA